ncbi:hypothetical protein SAMN04488542_103123 [Fontibacillus panacisegetis]|uniref:Uncharacterized protein n=1 Tax=Fontibacillus panacisegetis TaxID=670482 RepID=A0A1G7GN17_9BACL|nr:hypothetical protein [Fontibacillus panacisegetis]SDE89389.1 hypothetical protein SAMN04488542_103123 [Fontibacillus panacisegetis]
MGSFDRKVERNQIKMNKKGKGPVINKGGGNPRTSLGAKGEGELFQGRKIILPVALVLLAGLYGGIGLIGNSSELNSSLYWITIGLYLLLALTIFLRKPYLRVNKNWLYTSRFNRDKLLEAGNIKSIKVSRNKVTIVPKSKDTNWIFYRTRNLFNTAAMGDTLEQFAKAYQVSFERE